MTVLRRGGALLLLTMFGAVPVTTEEPELLGPAVAGVVLRDQLGGSDSVAAHRGNVTVAMVVTAARLRNVKAWQRDLQERFEELDFVLIADVPAEPPVTFERVANRLSEKVPAEVPVLIDLDRLWARELELDTERPNILLFDRQGALADRFRGLARQDVVEEAVRKLEELVGE